MSDFRRLPATTRAIGSRLISQEAPNKHRRCGRGPRVVELLDTLSYLKTRLLHAVACLRHAFPKGAPRSLRASDDAVLRRDGRTPMPVLCPPGTTQPLALR